jgi:mitochondrial chaperone BCS1
MDISQFIGNNQFLSGGFTLMVLGFILAYFRNLPAKLWDFFERFFLLKIEILDEDEAYMWMQVWLAEKLKDTLSISVISRRNSLTPGGEDDGDQFKDKKPKIYFVPAVGTYFFWYKRRFVTLYRDRRDNATSNGMTAVASGAADKNVFRTKESFTIRVWSRNKQLARDLIEECRLLACPEDGKIDIRIATYNYWTLGTRVHPRPFDGVILDGNQAQFLKSDMQRFLDSYEWYQKTGVPYRRSYLLHGEPGSGKSSIVKALAGAFDMNIYLVVLSDPDMNDNRINDLLNKVSDRNILLLEDIDCAFIQRTRKSGKEGGLTFSGLLNAIDGVASAEGRIIFMTTNHLDRLDPALIRPGRADVKLYFGNATQDQASRMFARFFPDHAKYAYDFGRLIPEREYSMAIMQDYLMMHRDEPLAALEHTKELEKLIIPKVELIVPKEPEEIISDENLD